jgi:hypothetical protein
VSILGFDGKNATPGKPCLYHMTGGQAFFSEAVIEEEDGFIFDGDKTAVITISQGNGPKANLRIDKLSHIGFQTKYVRVFKHGIAMITDAGDPKVIETARQALSGIVTPGVN